MEEDSDILPNIWKRFKEKVGYRYASEKIRFSIAWR